MSWSSVLTHGKRDYLKLVRILAPDWDELDDEPREQVLAIAQQVMEKSLEIFNEKAKFVTVGQMFWTEDDGRLSSWDPKAEKLCIGFFSTEKQAHAAAMDLGGALTAKERFRTWELPIWHGTPGEWRKARKKAMQEEMAPETQCDRLNRLNREREMAKPRCEKVAPDDNGDFLQCVRRTPHPGDCFPRFPESWGDVPDIPWIQDKSPA